MDNDKTEILKWLKMLKEIRCEIIRTVARILDKV